MRVAVKALLSSTYLDLIEGPKAADVFVAEQSFSQGK
jgi:hypothetical protein